MKWVRNAGALFDPLLDGWDHGELAAIRDFAHDNFAATFDHAEDDVFVVVAPLVLATNECLVDLDNGVSAKRPVAIGIGHVLADFMAHTPRAFVRHAKLALDFLGRNAVAGHAEQEHDVEPLLQRCTSALERSARHGVQMMFAPLALISGMFPKPMPLCDLTTLGTRALHAVASFHKMIQTGFIRGKPPEEILYVERLSPSPLMYEQRLHMSRGFFLRAI